MATYLTLLSEVSPDQFDQWCIKFLSHKQSLKRSDTAGIFCTSLYTSRRYTSKFFRPAERERFIDKTLRSKTDLWTPDLVVKLNCLHPILKKTAERLLATETDTILRSRASKLLQLLEAYQKQQSPFEDLSKFLS